MKNVKARDYDVAKGEAGVNISWASILAGLVTFVALNVLFSLIGAAIGFGTLSPASPAPFNGVGTGLIIWTIISIVLSFVGAGFISGLTANRAGFIHGFLTWAVSVIASFLLVSSLAVGAFQMIGQAVGSIGSSAGSAIGSVADEAGNLTQDAFSKITENVNVDMSNLDEDTAEILEQTNIPELQPDYLQSLLDETIQEIKDAGYAVVVNGDDLETVTEEVVDNIESRVSNITDSLERDDLEQAVENNSDLSEDEVSDIVDNAMEAYDEAYGEAINVINEAKVQLHNLSAQANIAIDEARQTADEATTESAKISVYAFLALTAGLLLSAFAGNFGSKFTSPYL